jgi:hypothetical protein
MMHGINHVGGISAEKTNKVDKLGVLICSSRGKNDFELI